MPRHATTKPILDAADLDALKAEIAADVAAKIAPVLAAALRKQASDDRSVSAFCRRWGFSRFLFYELVKRGEAPAVMAVGSRRLISPEAEARWIAEREAEALTAPKRIIGKPRDITPKRNGEQPQTEIESEGP